MKTSIKAKRLLKQIHTLLFIETVQYLSVNFFAVFLLNLFDKQIKKSKQRIKKSIFKFEHDSKSFSNVRMNIYIFQNLCCLINQLFIILHNLSKGYPIYDAIYLRVTPYMTHIYDIDKLETVENI